MGLKPPRDPARIDPLLALVRELWMQYPDLRLGQIIVNAIRPGEPVPRIFFAEDDIVEHGLREMLQRSTPGNESKAQHGS